MADTPADSRGGGGGGGGGGGCDTYNVDLRKFQFS